MSNPGTEGARIRRVLIVEDEWLLAEGLKVDLEERGFVVLGPSLSCKDALSILADHDVELAFIDTQLAGETCEAVLDDCAKRGIPVVIFTGCPESDLPEFARGRRVLSKPYDLAALVTCLSERPLACLEPLEFAFDVRKLSMETHEGRLGLLENPAFDGCYPIAQQAGLSFKCSNLSGFHLTRLVHLPRFATWLLRALATPAIFLVG